MKLYRVTTTFLGADAPSKFYFNSAEKAEDFLEKECPNGVYEPVSVISRYELNFWNGCTMNDLTEGQFDAKEIVLQPEGWYESTKALGFVYLNEYGRVVRSERDGVTVYPYRWDAKLKVWNNCSGCYTPKYLSRLMAENKAKFA